MKFFICIFVMSGLLFSMDISGIKLSDTMTVGNTKLVLNGAGVREKFFMDIYVGGLYLKQKSSSPEKIIAADDTMSVRLHIVSSLITGKKMTDAINEGFDNSTDGTSGLIRKEIDKFLAVFKEEIKVNDVYDMTYFPDRGVEIYKNKKLYDTISGLKFKKALFGIWLSGKPAQKSLKEEMLGI